MADPLPYSIEQLGQLPESGDPRTFLDYQLRIIKGAYENGSIGGGGVNIFATDPSAQTVAGMTNDSLTFTAETYSDGITHSTVTDTFEFTVITPGVYSIGCSIEVQNGTADAIMALGLRVNGTAFINDTRVHKTAGETIVMQVVADYKLVEDDTVAVVFGNQGAASADALSKKFWMTKY